MLTIPRNYAYAAHFGYLDGLANQDPDPELSRYNGCDYDRAWLIGQEDRKAGKTLAKYHVGCGLELPVKAGDTVTLPKGTVRHSTKDGTKTTRRVQTIKVHSVDFGSTGYFSGFRGDFVRPVNPVIVWVGAGSYWYKADVNALV